MLTRGWGRLIPQAASTAIVGDDSDGVRLNGSANEGVQVVMSDQNGVNEGSYDDVNSEVPVARDDEKVGNGME